MSDKKINSPFVKPCIKCGSTDAHVLFIDKEVDGFRGNRKAYLVCEFERNKKLHPSGEHMHIHCRHCHHEYWIFCKDRKKKKPSPV